MGWIYTENIWVIRGFLRNLRPDFDEKIDLRFSVMDGILA